MNYRILGAGVLVGLFLTILVLLLFNLTNVSEQVENIERESKNLPDNRIGKTPEIDAELLEQPYAKCRKNYDQPCARITIDDEGFKPVRVLIPIDTYIEWENEDGFSHRIENPANLFGSPELLPNDVYAKLFTKPGSYVYETKLASGTIIEGTVVVR